MNKFHPYTLRKFFSSTVRQSKTVEKTIDKDFASWFIGYKLSPVDEAYFFCKPKNFKKNLHKLC